MDLSLIRDIPISAAVVIALVLALRLTDRVMERQAGVTQFTRQLTMVVLSGMVAFIALIGLPDTVVSNSDVIRLAGVTAGVLVTLSSTTLLANAMAGLMMRNVKSFKMGDFIEVDQHIGRVSQRGLFHVEIQTVQSDLVTLPNQFLITRPLKVIRSSGTFITADVSLGYDAAHQVVEPLLIEAAERTGLVKSFVQVLSLGDYTVTYRVSGFLEDSRTLFTAESSLRRRVLDSLHDASVEIASPMLVGHRGLSEQRPVIPRLGAEVLEHTSEAESAAPADIVFAKAEEAAADHRASTELDQKQTTARALEQELKKAEGEERPALEERLAALTTEIELLETELEAHEIDDEAEDRV